MGTKIITAKKPIIRHSDISSIANDDSLLIGDATDSKDYKASIEDFHRDWDEVKHPSAISENFYISRMTTTNYYSPIFYKGYDSWGPHSPTITNIGGTIMTTGTPKFIFPYPITYLTSFWVMSASHVAADPEVGLGYDTCNVADSTTLGVWNSIYEVGMAITYTNRAVYYSDHTMTFIDGDTLNPAILSPFMRRTGGTTTTSIFGSYCITYVPWDAT